MHCLMMLTISLLSVTGCGDDEVDADGDGWSESGGDCDDADALTYPGAAFEEDADACMTDADGDGFGAEDPADGVEAGTDCDDTDDSVYPGAPEESETDAWDQSCDGPGE